jgi:glycosyltransferase involved in cell wall biosynthesis
LYKRHVEDSPVVVVSSHAARRDIETNFPESVGKLRVLHFHTVMDETWLEPDPRETAARYALPERFLFLPNQFWAHKEHQTAFEAVRRLHARGIEICLACTGTPADPGRPDHYANLEAFVAEHGLASEIRLLGRIPRNDYFQLIRAAHAVVQPSRFEGWSSTVEDARAFGKSIVLSDIDVHLEQAPERARYFPVGDADALADAMAEMLQQATPHEERVTFTRQKEAVAAYARTALAIFAEASGTRH